MKSITKEMINVGLGVGVIKLITDPNGSGTVCEISDGENSNWFYFGGGDAEGKDPKEYMISITREKLVNDIFETLDEIHDEDLEEYKFYDLVLSDEKLLKEAFLERIHKEDLYNPDALLYVWEYNCDGAVVSHRFNSKEDTDSIALDAEDEYWGGFLSGGDPIYDDPAEFVDEHYNEPGWMSCDEYTEMAKHSQNAIEKTKEIDEEDTADVFVEYITDPSVSLYGAWEEIRSEYLNGSSDAKEAINHVLNIITGYDMEELAEEIIRKTEKTDNEAVMPHFPTRSAMALLTSFGL